MNTKPGIEKWHEADGDSTLALDWPLNEDSHVWEIGGFEGRWAQQIWDKYHCNITIFEPQAWAVERMKKRFAGISKIDIRPYGLWTHDDTLALANFETDGASMVSVQPDKPIGMGKFVDYFSELEDFPHAIDVALMNIEGAEYILLPEFVWSGVIMQFKNIWCQFHPDGESDDRHIAIFDQMGKTHEMIWNCFRTAVAWRKR